MLNTIRNKSKGFLAYFIVGLISFTFIFLALADWATSPSAIIVAEIDGEEIFREDFLLEFNLRKRSLQQQVGADYNAELDARLKQSVINTVVSKHLLEKFANRMGLVTTPGELKSWIESNDLFKEEGVFSLDRYQQLLRLNGYSNISQYEYAKQQEFTETQIKNNFLNSDFVLPFEIERLQKLNNQERKFDYIFIDIANYSDKITADIEKAKKFYDSKKESFFDPQKVKVDYIELSMDKITKDIKVDEDKLLDFYEQEQGAFTTEEQRSAQHILIDDEQKAAEILNRLNKGEDFSQLAKQYSEDTGSKDNAGDLGFFTKGVMVPEFEEKVFAMQEAEVSDLVKSEFGYHIIKLNKIQPSVVQSFDEVKPDLVERYTQIEAQKLLYSLAEQLSNLAYESSLEEVAEQTNLPLSTSDFFTRSSTDYSPVFINVAFSDLVLNRKENSELIELSTDKLAVLRLNSQLERRQKSFDEVKEQIVKDLALAKMRELADNLAKKITNAFNSGEDKLAQELIDENQLKWKNVGWVRRDSDLESASLIGEVFKIPKPSGEAPTYTEGRAGGRGSLVVRLADVRTFDDKSPDTQIRQLLLESESSEVFSNIVATLRQDADIKIFAERL